LEKEGLKSVLCTVCKLLITSAKEVILYQEFVLATSHKNYELDHRENFTIRCTYGQEKSD